MESAQNIIGNIPIYWINLERSVERRKNMEMQFKKYGLDNNFRIEAIDKITITKPQKSQQYKKYMTRGEIGCSLSHMKAIRTSYNNDDEYCIIMEDDADFSILPKHTIPIRQLLKKSQVKCVQLFSFSMHYKWKDGKKPKDDLNKGHHWSALAYILKRDRMKQIIKRNKCDIADAKNYIYDKYHTFHVSIPYFIPSLFISEINNTVLNKHATCVKFWKNFYNK